MKTSYLLTGRNKPGKITLHYDEFHFLIGIESEEVDHQQLGWLYNNLPRKIEQLEWLKKEHGSKIKIEPISQDLSFKAFWNAYSYKVGKKAQTERTWESMSKANKAKAIAYIKQYNQHCSMNNIAKAYPSTYLNQRYYDTE